MRRSPIASPNPISLVGTGVYSLGPLSPDEALILFTGGADPNGLASFYLASTITPGTPTTLRVTNVATLPFLGSAFTADSSQALFLDNVNIEVADVAATPLRPTMLVARADWGFRPTSGKDHIVYTHSADPATAGLYLLALP